MQMKKIIAGTSALALSLSMTSVAFAQNATDNQAINLEVEVVDTLSMDCFDVAQGTGFTTVVLGTTGDPGMVTAGVPAVGKSRCQVVTNDDEGYYLTIEKTTEGVTWADAGGVGTGTTNQTTVLTHEDVNIDGTWYDIADKAAWNYGVTTPALWSGTGLGFSVVAFPDATLANNDFSGTWVTTAGAGEGLCLDGEATDDDVAVYAGVPDAAEAIAAVPEYTAGTTTTDVCYKVDVPPTQESGVYGGQVTFTATADASDYIN